MTAQGKERQPTRLICAYPSNLNKNASKFEGCWTGNDQSMDESDVLHCYESFENFSSESEVVQSLEQKCALGGDLILCRLSSSLYRSLDGIDGFREKTNSFPILPQDSCIILPTLLSSSPSSRGRPSLQGAVSRFLNDLGIEEVESLQSGGAGAGQCQFASLASALTWNYDVCLSSGYRPDLELRKLALHVIETNTAMYQHYLTMAGGRTRSHKADGGSSIDCRAYLRTMSSPSCDGDAVTLQALCDALQVTVRVVKAVDADTYNENSLRQRLHSEAYTVKLPSKTNEDDDMVSVITISDSDDGVSFTSDRVTAKRRGRACGKRLFISSEIRPRPLKNVDSRLKELQKMVGGRLVWLSHIGNEAHYRFLRPIEAQFCAVSTGNRLLISQRETDIAVACQIERLRKVQVSSHVVELDTCEETKVNEGSTTTSRKRASTFEKEGNNRRGKRQSRRTHFTNISHWGVQSYS